MFLKKRVAALESMFHALTREWREVRERVALLEKPKLELTPSRKPYAGLRCGKLRHDGLPCMAHVKRAGDVCRYHAKSIAEQALDRTNHAE